MSKKRGGEAMAKSGEKRVGATGERNIARGGGGIGFGEDWDWGLRVWYAGEIAK